VKALLPSGHDGDIRTMGELEMTATGARPDRGLGAFRPVRLRKAPEEILAVLIDAFRAGLYGPGDLLPRELDLSDQLGVSRVVVRDAIQRLRDEGIVATKRGRTGGTVVASFENLTRLQTSLRGDTVANIRTILEFRRPLELTAALMAARRASPQAMAALEAHVVLLERSVERPYAEFINIDAAFHLAVPEAAQNILLQRSLSSVMTDLIAAREHFPVGQVPSADAAANQRKLFEAISSRDESAIASAIDEHMAALEHVLLGTRLAFPCVPATWGDLGEMPQGDDGA
jgi:GntR family transcriptional repressor for pyruvate dehydrogenase complex